MPRRPASAAQPAGTALYERFVADMKSGGFRALFNDKPVLLRLIATVTRQWLDTSRELILRLDADLPAIRRDLLPITAAASTVVKIEGDLSDPHNFGRSVQIVTFADGARLVYKPKDLAARHRLGRADRAAQSRRSAADAEGGPRHRARRLRLDRVRYS